MLAVLAGAALTGAGAGPARAAPVVTSTPAPPVSTPVSTVGRCDPQWSTATAPAPAAYEQISPTRIRFAYTAPAAAGCAEDPDYATTTVTVFADAAGTQVAGRATTGLGSTSGSVRVVGLAPNVDYYYSVQASNTSPHGTVAGPVRTPTGVTPTLPPDYCQLFTDGTLRSATDSSLSFDYTNPRAGFCDVSARLEISTDETGREIVKTVRTPTGSEAGALTVTGLDPDTAYWARFVGSAFGPIAVRGPFRTLPQTTAPCRAVFSVLSSWGQGFVAQVTVTNTGSAAIDGWTADWTWANGERLGGVSGATPGGTATHPTLTGLSWNSRLGTGQTASAYLSGTGALGTTVPAPRCTAV